MSPQPIMHDFNIEFSDVDRGENGVLQSTIVRHPTETEGQLVARLLAYLLYYESDLEFVSKSGTDDEPELWSKGVDDKVVHWVDVGLPDRDRLVNASRHAQRVGLVAWGEALHDWEFQHILNLRCVPNLSVISLNQKFINSLVTRLEPFIQWSATIYLGSLCVRVGGETFKTVIRERLGIRYA